MTFIAFSLMLVEYRCRETVFAIDCLHAKGKGNKTSLALSDFFSCFGLKRLKIEDDGFQ